MIIPEALLAAGWVNIGGASWYHIGRRKAITCVNGKFQKWIDGKEIIIEQMSDL